MEVLLGKEAFDMDDADEEGNTLLHLAARHGNRKMCEVLLAAGSTIRRNKQGDTPSRYGQAARPPGLCLYPGACHSAPLIGGSGAGCECLGPGEEAGMAGAP